MCWVFIALHGFSLIAASGGYSVLWCMSFSLQWLLLLQSIGANHVGFRSCSMQDLGCRNFRSCSVQDLGYRGFRSCSMQDLVCRNFRSCSMQDLGCRGFRSCSVQDLGRRGFRSCSVQDLACRGFRCCCSRALECGLNSCGTCGVFQDQEWNLYPLHWQAHSYLLCHKESLKPYIF